MIFTNALNIHRYTKGKGICFGTISKKLPDLRLQIFSCFYRSIVFQLYIYVCDQFSITSVYVLRQGTKLEGEVLFVFVYGYLIFPLLFVESKDCPFTTKLSLPLNCLSLMLKISCSYICRIYCWTFYSVS